MKVYVDFKDLDAEDMPSNISNKYNLQIRSINSGSDYKNIKIQPLTDYTKQVRKQVIEEIREKFKEIIFDSSTIDEILDKIGEEEWII